MALPKYLVARPAEFSIRQRVRVVSWLANPNGDPVTDTQHINGLCFIKTEMYDNSDEAVEHADTLTEAGALFVSCQADNGESII